MLTTVMVHSKSERDFILDTWTFLFLSLKITLFLPAHTGSKIPALVCWVIKWKVAVKTNQFLSFFAM